MSQRQHKEKADSPETGTRPLYRRLETALTARIASGEWSPGAVLPSEQAIAAEYRVAPGTARKAVDQLVAARLVVRRHGSGTFVAPQDWQRAVSGFFRLIGDDGSTELPAAQLLRQESGAATAEEAGRLKLRPRARVIRLVRIRQFGDDPLIVEYLALPLAMFTTLSRPADLARLPMLYEQFGRHFGVLIREASENLRAVSATVEEARLLRLQPGDPLLEIDRVSISVQGRPVEWRVSRCNTARHSYLNRLD